jgi:hypothetical protein
VATKYCSVAPSVCLILSIEFPACHTSEARNSEEAPTVLENLCTPVTVYCPTQRVGFLAFKTKQRLNSVLNTAHHT